MGTSAALVGVFACSSTVVDQGVREGTGGGSSVGGAQGSGAVGPGGSSAGGTQSTGGMGGTVGGGGSGGSSGSGAGGASGGSGGASGGSGGASGGSGMGGSNGSGGTGGSGGSSSCDSAAAPSAAACVIDEDLGVFVHPAGDDETGNGSRSGPFATLAHAVDVALRDSKRVYACATGGTFVENLVLDATHNGIEIYGGFDCGDWSYDTALRSAVESPATTALRISGTSGAHLENLALTPAAPSGDGASSIAALVADSSDVVLRRLVIAAKGGRPGAPGAAGSPGSGGSQSGSPPSGRNANCSDNFQQRAGPGWTAASSCGSRGGDGGYTFAFSWATWGGNGLPGTPNTNVQPSGIDNGGEGADYESSTSATAGQAGSVGSPGSAGKRGAAIGPFSAQGYAPPVGGDGANGHPGQGGGGGGSGVAFTCNGHGPSGGVGGMGGCGGTLGTGGQGGGASVALLSLNNTSLALDSCELSSAAGGVGGDGGAGGLGGAGASGSQPGSIGNPAVATIGGQGGRGGNGGKGGAGAGGPGGPSLVLVHLGELPIQRNGTVLSGGVGGDPGLGGDDVADDGDTGMAADVYEAP